MDVDTALLTYVAGALISVIGLCAILGRDAAMDRMGFVSGASAIWPIAIIAITIVAHCEFGFWLHDRFNRTRPQTHQDRAARRPK